MPNWGPNHCLKRFIHNSEQQKEWYARNDNHCRHQSGDNLVCCWCCGSITPLNDEHGPHLPRVSTIDVETLREEIKQQTERGDCWRDRSDLVAAELTRAGYKISDLEAEIARLKAELKQRG